MQYRRKLPHVDPEARRGPLLTTALRPMSSKAAVAFEGSLFFQVTAWRLVPILMRLTGGRFAWLVPLPIGVIETRDQRNGRPHRRAVLYFHDGERVTVIPSKAGLPEDPFWYRNALSEPAVSSNPGRTAPSRSRTRRRGDGCGSSPTASTPRASPTASAPAAPAGPSRCFSCCRADHTGARSSASR